MDERLRRIERQALAGDPEAEILWRRLCGRRGLYFRDHQPDEILTEWEKIQQDYDDLAWQGRPWRGLLYQWCGCRCCGYQASTAKKLVKGRDLSFCDNWGDNNAKRKTLRTHRDGSRKNYKLKRRRDIRTDESSISDIKKERARRRKKRFGGRGRLYGREWVWNPETQQYRIFVWVRHPDE